jgi:hypothetical protein
VARLRERIAQYGWPVEDREDGAEAAWLIAQHSVGESACLKQALELVRACAEKQRCPAWHAACLEDRIALHQGRTPGLSDPVD